MKGPTQQYSAGGGGDDIPLARVRFALRIWTRWRRSSAMAESANSAPPPPPPPAWLCVAVRGWRVREGHCGAAPLTPGLTGNFIGDWHIVNVAPRINWIPPRRALPLVGLARRSLHDRTTKPRTATQGRIDKALICLGGTADRGAGD
jgi:hypothetical protein